MTLFTGVFPPSPPLRIQESFPNVNSERPHDEEVDSDTESLPLPPPRQPYSSRLKSQHLALSVLPETIVPPSRDPSPDTWLRSQRKKDEVIVTLNSYKEEHYSAESGTVYLGDNLKLACTEFARCEWVGLTRRKKRRIIGPESEPDWDVGYGIGLPPLVDTDAEWEEWEKQFEVRKQEVLEERRKAREAAIEEKRLAREERRRQQQLDFEANNRQRQKDREERHRLRREQKRAEALEKKKKASANVPPPVVEPPAPAPPPQAEASAPPEAVQLTHHTAPALDTRVETWRNAVLPSSQVEPSQIPFQEQATQAQAVPAQPLIPSEEVVEKQLETAPKDATIPGFSFEIVQSSQPESQPQPQVHRSQSSQLSFKVVKNHSSTSSKKKDEKSTPVSRIMRRELPPSAPVVDPLHDILVESSQPQREEPLQQLQSKAPREDEVSINLQADDESDLPKETQAQVEDSQESFRVSSSSAVLLASNALVDRSLRLIMAMIRMTEYTYTTAHH